MAASTTICMMMNLYDDDEVFNNIVDEVLPRIEPMLEGKAIDVIVGDARDIVPKLQADVAVTDIDDDGYGCNTEIMNIGL